MTVEGRKWNSEEEKGGLDLGRRSSQEVDEHRTLPCELAWTPLSTSAWLNQERRRSEVGLGRSGTSILRVLTPARDSANFAWPDGEVVPTAAVSAASGQILDGGLVFLWRDGLVRIHQRVLG